MKTKFTSRIERKSLRDLLDLEGLRKVPFLPIFFNKKSLVYVSPFTVSMGEGLLGAPTERTKFTIYGSKERTEELASYLGASEYPSTNKGYEEDRAFIIGNQ